MTRERFEVIQREFEQAIKCQAAFGGVEAPLLLWGETIKALEETRIMLNAWQSCGLTEEMLRDHEGYLKFNRGVGMVSEQYLSELQTERDALVKERDFLSTQNTELLEDVAAVREEWVCEKCKTVFPGPPTEGFDCVHCPSCSGDTAPLTSVEIKRLQAEGEALKVEIAALQAKVKELEGAND